MAKRSASGQLKFLFDAYTPEVRAGSRSNNRFAYQEAWSLDHLLDHHGKLNDYLAAFDFLEDFVIFEDTKTLKVARLFQIKTKDTGTWKLGDLTKKKKSQKCFVDKLADNITTHKKLQLTLFLVVNGSIQIALKTGAGSPQSFGFTEIDVKDEKKILKKTIVGQSKTKYAKFSKVATVLISALPLDESQRETQLKGKLADFITALFPNRSYQILPIFNCLKAEISRRSKYELEIKNEAALREKKAISKDQFAQFVSIGVDKTEHNEWLAIQQRLNVEKVPLSMVSAIRDGYNELTVLLTTGSPTLEKLAADVRKQIEAEEKRQTNLIDLIEVVYNTIKTEDYLSCYKESTIRALVAHEYQKKG